MQKVCIDKTQAAALVEVVHTLKQVLCIKW